MSNRSDSIVAALNYGSASWPAMVAGAAAAGRMLGVLTAYSTPLDAAEWSAMAARYTASKNGTPWPVSAFWAAFRHQLRLTQEAQQQS